MTGAEIISLLPYTDPFLFVDEIEEVTENGVKGTYTFKETAFFYQGHFKDNPVTPGVILTECMAQIGLVSLGIYLLRNTENLASLKVAFTSSNVDFIKTVRPEEKITVISDLKYFRFNKLKCNIKLFNNHQELVCEGVLAGMFSI